MSRVKVDGVAKGNYRRKKDSLKDESQEKTKAMLPEKCLASCPEPLSKCRKCLKIGHLVRAFKSSKAGKLFEIATYEENFYLGKQVDLKIDSGTNVTVMPYDTLLSLDLHTKLEPTNNSR